MRTLNENWLELHQVLHVLNSLRNTPNLFIN